MAVVAVVVILSEMHNESTPSVTPASVVVVVVMVVIEGSSCVLAMLGERVRRPSVGSFAGEGTEGRGFCTEARAASTDRICEAGPCVSDW